MRHWFRAVAILGFISILFFVAWWQGILPFCLGVLLGQPLALLVMWRIEDGDWRGLRYVGPALHDLLMGPGPN